LYHLLYLTFAAEADMPVYQRKDFPRLLKEIKEGHAHQVYLLHGERFLCREATDELISHLLPDDRKKDQQLRNIDGEQENSADLISQLRTYNLFGGRLVFRVSDARVFDAMNREGQAAKGQGASPPPAGQGEGEHLAAVLEAGLPAANILVLVSEAVDKRRRLYKYIENHGVILDLAVEKGSSAAARKDQENLLRELAVRSFSALGKKIEPRALSVLLERVGFHPVAVVIESEKLALHAGENQVVTQEDLDLMLGRTREEALYELTEAVGGRDLETALLILRRLQESQLHGLVIIAGLRNFLKKLLLIRAYQELEKPCYQRGMAFSFFQQGYLPQLKASCTEWPSLLAGHPFVLYKIFCQAEKLSASYLRKALARLLEAEYRLKSSRLPDRLILEDYLFQLLLENARQQAGT
jgi:DNA polymerase III delta subunit